MEDQNKRIGQKIRELRRSLGMTQAELAGDAITRNMLSLLETGSASPSLHTLTELSKRLNVPVGYFFAATEEESSQFTKMGMMEQLHRLYLARDYAGCIASCETLPHKDNEIRYLLSKCYLSLAKDAMRRCALRSAAEALVQAEKHAALCIYAPDSLRSTTAYLLALIGAAGKEEIPPTLAAPAAFPDAWVPAEWFVYMRCLTALAGGDWQSAAMLRESGLIFTPYCHDFLKACISMANGNTEESFPLLKKSLSETDMDFFTRYHALTALEVCASKISDYKAAYQYSAQKVHLLENFSK